MLRPSYKKRMGSAHALPILLKSAYGWVSQNFHAEARKIVGIGIIAMSIPRIIMP